MGEHGFHNQKGEQGFLLACSPLFLPIYSHYFRLFVQFNGKGEQGFLLACSPLFLPIYSHFLRMR